MDSSSLASAWLRVVLVMTLTIWAACSPSRSSRIAKAPKANLLNKEELAHLSDSALEQEIIDRVIAAITANPGREEEIVRGLPVGAKALYTTWWVEAEVNNGGFQQYFWNTEGSFANDALAGFELFGAEQHTDLMRRAIKLAEEERSTRDKYKAEGSLDAFSESYKDTKLGDLDDEFFKLSDLSAIRVRLIRERPELFAANNQLE
jgi:hypothetical protein